MLSLLLWFSVGRSQPWLSDCGLLAYLGETQPDLGKGRCSGGARWREKGSSVLAKSKSMTEWGRWEPGWSQVGEDPGEAVEPQKCREREWGSGRLMSHPVLVRMDTLGKTYDRNYFFISCKGRPLSWFFQTSRVDHLFPEEMSLFSRAEHLFLWT